MEENKTRKVIIMSMAGLLIGSLLYTFGISMFKSSILPMICNYIIAVLLYICSFLAVANNNKIESHAIYKYIMVLSIGLTALITYTTIYQLL